MSSSASKDLVFSLAILLLVLGTPCTSGAYGNAKKKLNTAVYLSPKIELGPGSVSNGFYYGIDFPQGHIALTSFNAEVVDEAGNPVPLHETYLHHWVVARYHVPKLATTPKYNHHRVLVDSNGDMLRNDGLCQQNILRHYFGLGSETRRTITEIPYPFGIEIGNPADIPEGHQEKWLLNLHAIDTRGVVDKLGCTECMCDLYNVTVDAYGSPLRPDYIGGLACCNDGTQCRMREGFQGSKRSIYLRYTIKWFDWDNSVVPVRIYILDVTDTMRISDTTNVTGQNHQCQIEYNVEPCSASNSNGEGCTHVKRTFLPMPNGGYVVYGVAHQHSGGIGSTLYGQDGRVLCSSIPTYGNGEEAGNEANYIVGMSSCFPRPGSITIADGETLTLESNYSSSSSRGHTGVMGLFYLLVADQLPKQHLRHSSRPSFFMDMMNNSTI